MPRPPRPSKRSRTSFRGLFVLVVVSIAYAYLFSKIPESFYEDYYSIQSDPGSHQTALKVGAKHDDEPSIAQQSAHYNWTILLTVNDGFYDFLLNWLYHFDKLGDLKEQVPVVVVAEDDTVYSKLKALKRNNFKVDRSSLSDSANTNTTIALRHATEGYKALVSMRPTHILRHLLKGENVIYTDVDTVWVANPLPYLDELPEYDMMMQVELILTSGTKAYCTGFMGVRANERTIDLMKAWKQRLDSRAQVNQPTFNVMVQARRKTLKSVGLPMDRFPNGLEYFSKMNETQREKVVVVHNNFIGGHENKRRRFAKHNLWYDPSVPKKRG